MESTHVYWIPIYELLESCGIEVLLVNARQFHNVPGRKTDMQDCQWLQLLHSCGLLRGSFRPHESITRLRALQRQMANLVGERTRFVQWMQQSLDQMNVQVHRAVGDLTGNWREEHLFNLESALGLYDAIQQRIASYEARLLDELHALEPEERHDQPVPEHPNPVKEKAIRNRGEQKARTTLWRFAGVDLTRIDGIGTGAAQIILTEVGLDLSSFPSENNFVRWLRLSPRTPISGGKLLRKKKSNGTGAAFRRKARHKAGAVAVFAIARKAGNPGLPHASIWTRLRRYRRAGLRGPVPAPPPG